MARTGKMYRVPQAGPRWPAVAGPVERRVRRSPTPYVRRLAGYAGTCRQTRRRTKKAVRAVAKRGGANEQR